MNLQRFLQMAIHMQLALRMANPLMLALTILCSAAAVLCLLLMPARHQQLEVLQSDLQNKAAASQRRLQMPLLPKRSADQANFEAFMANLGEARYTEEQLQSLFKMARGLEIGLPQGQYRIRCEESGLLCSYKVQLPVKGSYPQIRGFLKQALYTVPSLSLDELALKREAVSDEELDVRFVMTVMVRAPESSDSISDKVGK
jgi:hypothetical protein